MKVCLACLLVLAQANPYEPTWINDPESEIDCTDASYICDEGTENSCEQWPYRICVDLCPTDTADECYQGCQPNDEVKAACMHKALFPILPNDLLLYVVLFLVAIAAGAAGIGGGGLNVPITMIIAQFDIKEAVPLSHSAVLGNAIAQIIMNCPQKHPNCEARPLIHYELAFLLLPAMLGGSSLGVVLGRVLPGTLLVILSMGLLLLAATKTAKKGCSVYKDCKAIQSGMKKKKEAPPAPAPTQQENPGAPSGGGDALETPLSRPPQDNSMRVPWKIIGMMVAFNLFVLLDAMLQSKDIFGTVRCHGVYWASLIGLYPFVIGALWLGIKGLRELAKFHEDRGDGQLEGDPDVSLGSAVRFASLTAVVGLLAGILGLGGGEFMVPLLLEFGLLPRVASATSGFLIAFSTSNDVIHYLIAGTLTPILGYAVACIVVANLGAFLGLILRDTAYMRANSYIVVFVLAGLLFTSMGLLMYRGLIIDAISFEFKHFC